MRTYSFAKISARNFPTPADLRNPWIFPNDVAVVICVSQYYDETLADVFKQRGAEYHYLPLEEDVDDIGWENIKKAIAIILQADKEAKRVVVHCDFGAHRSRLVVEAFHFAKFGEHFTDEYHGYSNRIIYNCSNHHLPPLEVVEQELLQLAQTTNEQKTMNNIFSKLFQRKPPYKGIMGAIIGDIVGVPYEFKEHKSTEFKLFSQQSQLSDDTVMTVAVAEWLLTSGNLAETMRKWGKSDPYAGYGGMFYRWLFPQNESEKQPYNSYGNGSGMRVSPCGYFAKTLDEALDLAKQSAEVSHNHPEGIKGAQAIASAIFLARSGRHKKEIKRYIENNFNYDLSRTCDDIRPKYSFNECCQTSCPEAIIAFLDSHDYESAIRLAVSLGGDADTLACMAGGIAAAYYGVPQWILKEGRKRLTKEMLEVVDKFDELTNSKELVMDEKLDEYIKEFYNEVSTNNKRSLDINSLKFS